MFDTVTVAPVPTPVDARGRVITCGWWKRDCNEVGYFSLLKAEGTYAHNTMAVTYHACAKHMPMMLTEWIGR